MSDVKGLSFWFGGAVQDSGGLQTQFMHATQLQATAVTKLILQCLCSFEH